MAGKILVPYFILAVLLIEARAKDVNDRPIIGVMSHHTDPEKAAYGKSYISAGYVKFLESAGARVVPVLVNQTDQYYQHLFESLNGVLFTGGDVNLVTSGYARAGKIFYDLALEAFDKGDLFPMWGTCLGFQLFTALTSGENLLTHVDAVHVSYPLYLQKGYENSRMFQKNAESEPILSILANQKVTFNSHHYGITPETFQKNKNLKNFYQMLSTNYDENGKEFVSVIEGYKHPFYATQWHPEINPFEFSSRLGPNANHSKDAIRVTQYLANFFVNEARKSTHSFKDKAEESASLIYNYTPVYTGNFTAYEQCYFFG